MRLGSITGSDYGLLYDAYTGGGGFLDGSYLYRHKRESDEDYLARRLQSRYSNFVRVIVDSLVNPIFKKTVIRDWKSNAFLDAFADDVDGKGTNLHAFMKDAAKWARLYGKTLLIMDNYMGTEMAQSLQGALDARRYPYLYLIRPDQIEDYKRDRDGHLTLLSYKVHPDGSEEEQWTWQTDSWQVKRSGKLAGEGENPLHEVPAVVLSDGGANSDELLPVPAMLHIAKANRDLFNRDSEKREILRNQCFPVLVYPMTAQAAAQARQRDANGEEIGLDIGTNNMLNVDANAGHMPTFIAPPMQPVAALREEMQGIVDDMFRQASLTSVIAVQTKQSGVAKQWDFEGTANVLASAAESCEAAELQLVDLFCRWTNTETRDVRIRYPRTFAITDVEDELAKAQQMKDLAVGGEIVAREVDRKAAQAYFADIDDLRYDEVMTEIDDLAKEKQQARPEED